jgi:hypothetical protein
MMIVKRKFGWTNVDVPIIGQGTWMIESSSDSNNHLAIKALQLGIEPLFFQRGFLFTKTVFFRS